MLIYLREYILNLFVIIKIFPLIKLRIFANAGMQKRGRGLFHKLSCYFIHCMLFCCLFECLCFFFDSAVSFMQSFDLLFRTLFLVLFSCFLFYFTFHHVQAGSVSYARLLFELWLLRAQTVHSQTPDHTDHAHSTAQTRSPAQHALHQHSHHPNHIH